MLQHLTIQHYALIESLDIDFHKGFSVITGETGAGKSIMLGALNLLLGGRADAKAIQNGQKKCMVEASFQIGGLGLEPFFANNDIDYDANDCIVRREVLQSGKSRAFINDTPVSVSKLKEIGVSLIDIHSQHQNLLIRNELFLINSLDIMASQPQLVSSYKCLYGQCKQALQALKLLEESAIKGRSNEDYLRFQLNQIDELELQDGEQTDLENEQNILGHAEEIKQGLYQAKGLLGNDEISISHNIRQAIESLESIANNYEDAHTLAERMQSVRIELDDIEAEIEHAADNIDYDPARLQYVEERLSSIYELEQKHAVSTIEELQEKADNMRKELESIDNVDEDIQRQEAEVERLLTLRAKVAAQLTAVRKKAALLIQAELTETLKGLGMPNTRIKIKIAPRQEPDNTGADKVTFLFSANKNVPLQDVSAIASGGEIARLMLALKELIARRTQLPTIVFDEIDTGVSGTMAERMAQVMKQMSANCQVLCITHLPQIAAWGNHHFRVYKEDSNGSTRSHIQPLNTDERITELAHMLSGERLSDAAIENAKTLIQNAHN